MALVADRSSSGATARRSIGGAGARGELSAVPTRIQAVRASRRRLRDRHAGPLVRTASEPADLPGPGG